MGEDAVLGRVTDPSALDEERGPVAEYETFAPRAWSGRRARLELPKSVRCRACCGGGCDRCDRRGAFRLADDPDARAVELDLPAPGGDRVAIRLPHPFGDGSPIRQLIVVFEERADPDPRLRVLASPEVAIAARPEVPADAPRSWLWVGVAAAVAVVAALTRLLAG